MSGTGTPVETPVVETPVVETPVVETPVVTTTPETPVVETTVTTTPPEPDWKEKRIQVLTARLAEERAKNTQTPPAGDPPPSGLSEADVTARAQVMARQIAETQVFNQACNTMAEQGKKAYEDFDSKINELRKLVDGNDPQQVAMWNGLLSAAIETGEGAKVLYNLGSDLNEASKVFGLSPVKLGMELVRIAERDPGKVTGAPKPITPVQGSRAAHSTIRPDDPERADTLSTAEWIKRREAQVAESRKGAR